MNAHAAADLFPMMAREDLEALARDIKAHGLREPIVMLDGEILDGRNRHAACAMAGVEPDLVDYDGDDPIAYVVSKNIARRHLTASVRAMLAADLLDLQRTAKRAAPRETFPVESGRARARAAAIVGVSDRSVEDASTVLESGAPELVAAVRKGDVAVSVAADLSTLPKATQREVLALDDKAVLARAKEIREGKAAEKRAKRNKAAIDAAASTPDVDGIEILHGDARIAIARARELGGARLTILDSPWDRYNQRPGVAAPDLSYPVLDLAGIAAHIALVLGAATDDAYMVSWITCPLLIEAMQSLRDYGDSSEWAPVLFPSGWRAVTMGAWTKLGTDGKVARNGVGHHWRGAAEIALVYVRGNPGEVNEAIPNAAATTPDAHSAKPVDWTREWIRAWTKPGDVVLVPYLGGGSDAVAALAEGRRCVAAELHEGRCAEARIAVARAAEVGF